MSSGCSLVRSEKQQEVWISNRLNVKSEGGQHELRTCSLVRSARREMCSDLGIGFQAGGRECAWGKRRGVHLLH